MKLGYTMWIVGWLCLVGGIVAIILGIVQGQWFGVGRGLLFVGVSSWYLKKGADRVARTRQANSVKSGIEKAKQVFIEEGQRINEERKRRGLPPIRIELKTHRPDEEHKLAQSKDDEARR